MKYIFRRAAFISSFFIFAGTVQAQNEESWSKPGMTDARPHLSYSRSRAAPSFDMTCDVAGHIKFYVRGFTAAQKWPQPVLSIVFGSVEKKKRPNLLLLEQENWPDQTLMEIEFGIVDSVLEAIASGTSIRLLFEEQEQLIPAAPQMLRREFTSKCAALLPPGLRRG